MEDTWKCDNAAVQVSARDELFALDLFIRAEETGQQVTMSMVERRLEQLAAHRPTCICGVCELFVGDHPWRAPVT